MNAFVTSVPTLGWKLAIGDWEPPGVDELVRRVKDGLTEGAVVLMHDGPNERGQTVDAVARLIPELRADGYRVGKDPAHFLGTRTGGDVVILRRFAEQHVTDRAARQRFFNASAVKPSPALTKLKKARAHAR